MSLSQKKSRAITVDDVNYRFQISTTKIDDDWNYKLNITIQCTEENGGFLQVVGLLTRNFWLDFPDIKHEKDIEYYPVVKPNQVAKIIRLGLSEGWNPKTTGPPFILEIENAELFEN